MPDDSEVKDVWREESSRGKRPRDLAALRRNQSILRQFKEALEQNDVEKFKRVLIVEIGWGPGTPDYENALKVWDDVHRDS